MNSGRKFWPPSSLVLAVAGVALVGTGLYFILIRTPLLPEDVRYMGVPAAQFDVFRPRLEAWLTHVFRVMGGYVLATGVLTSVFNNLFLFLCRVRVVSGNSAGLVVVAPWEGGV